MKVRHVIQERLQGLGRALMLPIAVLPVAGLMLRLGQPDLLGLPFIAAAGQAVFAYLGLLFAIGVAVGLAKENHGAAGLAGAVAYVVLTQGAKVLMDVPADALPASSVDASTRDMLVGLWKDRELAKLSVPAGILCGLAAGNLYNRFHEIRFPEYLSFFGGRRFVPIISGLFGLLAAVLFGVGFPILESGIDHLSAGVTQAGSIGLFLYGVLNRILIVTGLHHILNNLAWFVLGDFQGATGDLNRFFAGDPNAGAFMSGFFPVMMFGLPAACFAMWRAARPERRPVVGGMFLSMALTSFLTGVTEPIEFTFMFLAPILFILHAVLTGLSMVLMDLLGIRIGFGFSAGLFDYVLNFHLSTRPFLLVPVGIVYSLIYYVTFSYVIRKFNLATPGRELMTDDEPEIAIAPVTDNIAEAYLAALGGSQNMNEISACTTRLRLVLADRSLVCEKRLRELGAKGIIEIGDSGLQVIIGPLADGIASGMRALTSNKNAFPKLKSVAVEQKRGRNISDKLVALFGGQENVEEVYKAPGRMLVRVRNDQDVDYRRICDLHVNRVYKSRDGVFHIIDEN